MGVNGATAKGGQKGEGVSGGAGYSGGGSDGDGGSDGADGCCGSASGEGSGLDLSSIQLETFALSAGAGGKKFLTAGGKQGGGGGGVLVDGEGPQDNDYGNDYNGQGYGGGGDYLAGYQGVVLMEIKAVLITSVLKDLRFDEEYRTRE